MSIWDHIHGIFQWQSNRIAKLEHRIEVMSEVMSAELDALQAATTAVHDAVAGADAKLKLMSDEIARLKAGATDAAAVASLAGTLHADAAALTSATAAAVV